MKYSYTQEIELAEEPKINWNKNTEKDILKYALGGLLYMPATNVKIVDDILNKRFFYLKSFVLCLEDSIVDSMVEKAEKCVGDILQRLTQAIENNVISIDEIPLIFIRVRNIGQMTKLYNMYSNYLNIITGFIWPKFDKNNAEQYIEEFKQLLNKVDFKLYGMPILESKGIMYKQNRIDNLEEIRRVLNPVYDNIIGIRVGGADLCNIFGLRRDVDCTIWNVNVVADCLADIINEFSRDYIVSGPIWEYFEDNNSDKWITGLKKEQRLDMMNGFIGKDSIHPSQLKIIQENLIVSYENYIDALKILNMDKNTGVEKGYGKAKMNEVKTHTNWARKILSLANIYGVGVEK